MLQTLGGSRDVPWLSGACDSRVSAGGSRVSRCPWPRRMATSAKTQKSGVLLAHARTRGGPLQLACPPMGENRADLAEQHGSAREEMQRAQAEIARVHRGIRAGSPIRSGCDSIPGNPGFTLRRRLKAIGVTVHDHSQFQRHDDEHQPPACRDRKRAPDEHAAPLRRAASATSRITGGILRAPIVWTRANPSISTSSGVSLWTRATSTCATSFRTCWHGVGETVRQCRTQWVDVLPSVRFDPTSCRSCHGGVGPR